MHFLKSSRFKNSKAHSDRFKSEKEISQVNFKTLIFMHHYQKFASNGHLEVRSFNEKLQIEIQFQLKIWWTLVNLTRFLVTKVVV